MFSRQNQFKIDSREKIFIDSFGLILPRDAESKVYEIKKTGRIVTETSMVEAIVGLMIFASQKKIFHKHQTSSMNVFLNVLNAFERTYFVNVICRLAVIETQGHVLNLSELSNVMLQEGVGCLADLNLFGLVKDLTKHQSLGYSDENATKCFAFPHPHVQHFLAAVHLLKSPIMDVFRFLKNYVLSRQDPKVTKNSSSVLCYFFGLAETVYGQGSTILLGQVLKYMSNYIDVEDVILDCKISLLILKCLFEAQEFPLYRQVHNETFARHILLFDAKKIEKNLAFFAHYMLQTSSRPNEPKWTIYCLYKDRQIADNLTAKVVEMNGSKPYIETNTKLTAPESWRMVISNKNKSYLEEVMSEINMQCSTETTFINHSGFKLSSKSPSPNVHHRICKEDMIVPYGYHTEYTFKNDRKMESNFFFNMVSQLLAPELQMHSGRCVNAEFINSDQMRFTFDQSMRHKFYENTLIKPIIPLHWFHVRFTIILTYHHFTLIHCLVLSPFVGQIAQR